MSRSLVNFLSTSLACICLVLFACSQAAKTTAIDGSPPPIEILPVNINQESALRFDSTEIGRFFDRYPYVRAYELDIKSFYRKRNYTYAWFEKDGLIEQAAFLANKLSNLKGEGIYKRLYYQETLDSLLDEQKLRTDRNEPDINLELLLSTEYFVYSKLAWDGMNSDVSKSAQWFIPRKSITYEQYLDSMLNTPLNRRLPREPVYRQYELLRSYLQKYQVLESSTPWPTLATKKVVKAGDTSSLVVQVKQRLFKLGDYKGDTVGKRFNPALVLAVKHFQERHGLKADGALFKQTLAELNIPLKTRIKQILVNMERSRWLPLSLAGDHLAVNIPEFKLHVYHADSLLWSTNAVVGQTIHPTTQFYGEIKYIVFSPYWNVPPGILRDEILPAMKMNPNYLAQHNMEVTGYHGDTPIVRQKPGKSNSLGLVKFLFPNSYNIYLHDTPSKSLFDESSRAFSHGCIRISTPEKLAAFLLKHRNEWNDEKISQAMHAGKERYVTLKNPVPVFIAYFTAFTDRNRRLNFRKDIYNLDDRLAEIIISGEGY